MKLFVHNKYHSIYDLYFALFYATITFAWWNIRKYTCTRDVEYNKKKNVWWLKLTIQHFVLFLSNVYSLTQSLFHYFFFRYLCLMKICIMLIINDINIRWVDDVVWYNFTRSYFSSELNRAHDYIKSRHYTYTLVSFSYRISHSRYKETGARSRSLYRLPSAVFISEQLTWLKLEVYPQLNKRSVMISARWMRETI